LTSYIIEHAKEEYISKLERLEIDKNNEGNMRWVKEYAHKREERDVDITGNGEETK
jgi:hypothetical protein